MTFIVTVTTVVLAVSMKYHLTFSIMYDLFSFKPSGGYPYPTMSNRDIIDLLSRGYRMDKPELCSDEVWVII